MDTISALPRASISDLSEVMTGLLSSRVRYKLLALFMTGQDTPRHARQIAKDTGEHFNSVWQELKHLESLGLLASEKVGSQVRYCTDPSCPLLPELRDLLRKAEGLPFRDHRPAAPEPTISTDTRGTFRAPGSPTGAARWRPAAGRVIPFVIGEVD